MQLKSLEEGAALPIARMGTSLAVAGWQDNGLRVYSQVPDMTVNEHCWDGTGMWGSQKHLHSCTLVLPLVNTNITQADSAQAKCHKLL